MGYLPRRLHGQLLLAVLSGSEPEVQDDGGDDTSGAQQVDDEQLVDSLLENMTPDEMRVVLGSLNLSTRGLRVNLVARLETVFLEDEDFLAGLRASHRFDTQRADEAAAAAAIKAAAASNAAALDNARRSVRIASPVAAVTTMAVYPSDDQVLEHGCEAIAHLAVDGALREQTLLAGGAAAVVSAMRTRHSKNLQRLGCLALLELSSPSGPSVVSEVSARASALVEAASRLPRDEAQVDLQRMERVLEVNVHVALFRGVGGVLSNQQISPLGSH